MNTETQRTRAEVDARNAETSRLEVEAFKRDAPSPYFAYHAPARLTEVTPRGRAIIAMGTRITTWTGDDLARVIYRGEVWTSNFGDRRQSFRARSIDGETIYGGTAYLDAGDYVRMRAVA